MSRRIEVPLETPAPEGAPRKVLIPLDGSGVAESVLDSALLTRDMDLVFLRVVPFAAGPVRKYVPESEHLAAEAREEAESYLAGIVARFAGWSRHVNAHVLMDARVAKAITDYADEIGADLIAMATHGRGGVARAILGSVADQVMRTSAMPVLLIPPVAAKHEGSALAEAAAT